MAHASKGPSRCLKIPIPVTQSADADSRSFALAPSTQRLPALVPPVQSSRAFSARSFRALSSRALFARFLPTFSSRARACSASSSTEQSAASPSTWSNAM
eukprot:2850894-Pleurochrysis_carterae.AAC.1